MRRLAVAGAALLLLACAVPASACGSGPTDVAAGRVFMPDGPHSWTSPVGRMRAGRHAFLTLGLLAKGDRWELPAAAAGASGPVTWKAEARAEGGLILWLSAEEGGQGMIGLRYVFANGRRSPVDYIVIVEPPPPPPGPWMLDVDRSPYRNIAIGGRETILRMALPLPAGRRWQVKEAAFLAYPAKDWQTLPVEPLADRPGAFRLVPRGEKARITLEESGDGWLLFPETAEVELVVDSSVPKC